ncbi:MAG: terminase small subunit [Sedimentisphaerales bacterium]|nr:terminase small subunit [Sedimentisphaerales bacterium]
MNNEIEKSETLTPKEESFCLLYTEIGSETFCHGTLSAERAGYAKAGARTQAWKLLRIPKIRERIAEIHSENMSLSHINVHSQLAKLENLRQNAEEKGDLSSAIRAVELTGKYLQMFNDRHVIVTEQQQPHKMSPELAEDVRKAFELIYAKRYLASQAVKQIEDSISQSDPYDPQAGPS